MFIGTIVAYIFSIYDMEPFELTGPIGKGFPPIALPPFSTELISQLGSAIVTIPLISILETVTIATIFCGTL